MLRTMLAGRQQGLVALVADVESKSHRKKNVAAFDIDSNKGKKRQTYGEMVPKY